MTNFIIDPKHISNEDILADLQAFIASKPDAEAWKDYFAGSAGTTLTELVAGMGSFLAYQTIIARREAFLRYAKNRSSLIGHAQNRGYSVYRGLNPRVSVTITPTITTTVYKYADIGSIKDSDLIALKDVALVAGTPVTIPCTIGAVKSESIAYEGNSGPAYFRFKQPMVSEDVEISVNGVVVETSKKLSDAEKGKFVIQSNAIGSVDVFYLNDPKYSVLKTNDIVSIKYVVFDATQFAASDVKCDYTGVQLVTVDQRIITPESNTAIAANAPLYAETQYVVRAREDYIKILRLLNPSIVEVGYSDISPMVVAMHYIKSDLVLLTPAEKLLLIDGVTSSRNLGLEPPVFKEPVRVPLTLICSAKYSEITAGLDVAIKAICATQEKIFGKKIDFDSLENQVEDLDGIKIARFEIGSIPWSAGMKVRTGQHVSNGSGLIIQRAAEILYKSGSSEPVWPTEVGQRVTDGDIIWECRYFERQCDPLNPTLPLIPPRATWTANTNYKVNQIVIPSTLDIYEYKVVEVINKSGATEPVWTKLQGKTPEQITGSYVYDGDILWQACPVLGTPTEWEATKIYKEGDAVIAIDQDDSDTVGVMFQCVGFLGTTNGTMPAFTGVEYDDVEDGNIKWRGTDKTKSPAKLRKNEFFQIDTQVSLSSGATVL